MKNNDLQLLIANYVIENKEKIYRLAFHYMQIEADALDVVQIAIIKAISNKASLDNPEYIKTWMYRIVVNAALDELRKRKKVVVVDSDVLATLDKGELDVYKDTDLYSTVDKLPPQYQRVVILRYFEDLKIEEIAKVLDEKVSTVKTRLYKALQLLKLELTEEIYQ